jgi:hypothetical protein
MMRKYICQFFIAFLYIFIPTSIYSWWVEPLHGDLTRMGRWSEHDFGPNADQPVIQVEASGKFISNPDILVLGDSFSASNLWQSVLSREQKKTIKTSNYNGNCIPNWINYSITQSTSSIVIIQSVERNIISIFNLIAPCSEADTAFMEVASSSSNSHRPGWPLALDFSYLSATAINTLKLNFSNEGFTKSKLTVNEPLINDCALFSNRRNDRLLYYLPDDNKLRWTEKEIEDSISNILKIQKTVEESGKKFIFIVAPDKSTTYRKCSRAIDTDSVAPNINQLLIEAGVNAPDMSGQFRSKIGDVIDLYDPNNTHWSASGYVLAGNIVSRYISHLQPGNAQTGR